MRSKISNSDKLEADIDRWFNRSPFGIVLKGDKGRLWPLTEAQASQLRQQAIADIQNFLVWQRQKNWLFLLLLIAFAFSFDWLASLSIAVGMPWLMVPTGLVFFAPLMPFVWLFLFRRRQHKLKRNFIQTLDRVTPLTEEIAGNHVKKSNYSKASVLVIFVMILAVICAQLFAPRQVEALLGVKGMIIFVAVGIAIALTFEILQKNMDQQNGR
jgi:hypothetical protein